MNRLPVLTDQFGRLHTDLRVSVTDRCNIRCIYCMPDESIRFQPRHELLTFEEIVRFVRVASDLGIESVRLTGGEPLLRCDLPQLVAWLAALPKIRSVALTTNGILLRELAMPLKLAGLDRINISLDTLDPKTFLRLTRREGLARVLDGIAAAIEAGFPRIRLNAIAYRGQTEDEVERLVRFGAKHHVEMRFIEFMPLDADQGWSKESVLTGKEIRQQIESQFGPMIPLSIDDPSQPAVDYWLESLNVRLGFINPVSEPFCDRCNRVRLTSDGKVFNCLFSKKEFDVRRLLRGAEGQSPSSDVAIAELIRRCVAEKKAGHGMDGPEFQRPDRSMYQIGG